METPLLKFRRKNRQLVVQADSDLPSDDDKGETYFSWYWDASSPAHAELLLRYFRASLAECVESIRRESYEQGRKDGIGKRKKATVFCSALVAGLNQGGCW